MYMCAGTFVFLSQQEHLKKFCNLNGILSFRSVIEIEVAYGSLSRNLHIYLGMDIG